MKDTARYHVRRCIKLVKCNYDENKNEAPEIYTIPNSSPNVHRQNGRDRKKQKLELDSNQLNAPEEHIEDKVI